MPLPLQAGALARRALQRLSPALADRLADIHAQRRHARSGSDWRWTLGPPCPVRRCEAGSIQVGSRLFLIGGLETMDRVLDRIDVFDMAGERWIERWPLPAGMPHSHHGMATDGRRFIYLAGGQLGPQCSPAVANVFALDAKDGRAASLPPLPEARYAATAELVGQRLHVIAGTRPDRHTPAADHWSLAVRDGCALETAWKVEPPIPRAGTHRGHTVVGDAILVFGGQEGDIRPHPDDPCHTCDFSTPIEPVHAEVHCLGAGAAAWERRPDMPEALSHIEGCSVVTGNTLLVFAGTEERHVLTNTIKACDLTTGAWRIAGKLPRFYKNAAVGLHDRTVYFIAGQCSKSATDRSPGRVVTSVWKARLPTWVR